MGHILPKRMIDEAVAALKKFDNNKAAAARFLNIARSTFQNRLAVLVRQEVKIKMLLLDIETAPNLGHVWSLWEQNISLKQLLASSYMLCWAAKWYGEEKIHFDSLQHATSKKMLVLIHQMLNEADVVISYNGARFDVPTLNKEFLLHGMTPPSPYKQVDLYRAVRKMFKFPSYKLDYVAQVLGLGKKYPHEGHQLWVDVMANKPKAWKTMKTYNIQDVVLMERVYEKIKGWIPNHPNQGLYNADPECCPTCGSTNIVAKGYAYTAARQYKRYRCGGCGSWSKGAYTGQTRKRSAA